MHLEGMLDRDQRTTKPRMHVWDEEARDISDFFSEFTSFDDSSNSSSINASRSTTKRPSHKRRYLRHSFQRLKKVLLVLAYLYVFTLPATSNSAPLHIKMEARMMERPKWINPCGITSQNDSTDFAEGSSDGVKDIEMLKQITQQVQIALQRANTFRDKFAYDTFGRNFDELFKGQTYPWLKKVPKNLGEDVPLDHLHNVKLEEVLVDIYEYLQIMAVGMEQIVWGQLDRPGLFPKEFKDQEDQIILILCELQMALNELNIAMRPDVTRDVMGNEFRYNMDTTQSNARDFIIFREYINTLEYVIKVFEHLLQKV